jgi:hypothetical protein
MPRDGDVPQSADSDRRYLLHADSAAITFVVPTVAQRLYHGLPAGETTGAHNDGRIAQQYQRPYLVDVAA